MTHVRSTTRVPSQALSISLRSQFKVAHQRVSLDIDLSKHSIEGRTEIMIIPLIQQLEFVAFDCKNMSIEDVLVENRRVENYIHDDPYKVYSEKYLGYNNDILYSDNNIEQSHFMRSKFSELSNSPTELSKSQLLIKIPSSVKISLQDSNSLVNYTPITPSTRTPANETIFTPISICIRYKLDHPHTGINFDTVSQESQFWNCYTTNSEWNACVSNWLPCIDSLDEKCTWELEFNVPKKVRDIGISKIVGSQPQRRSKRLNDIDSDDEEELNFAEEEDSPLDREILVVCSEFVTGKESAHPTDLAKKTMTFQIFNPVAPHHIGWAVGAFEVWDLPPFQQTEEPEEDQEDQNNGLTNEDERDLVPIQVYSLPSLDINESTALNTTLVCQNILDFYSKEFGSYPFTSYSLLFLPTIPSDVMNFAGTTFCNTRLFYPLELIDPMFDTTHTLAFSLATQWSGINITPSELNDIWCCIGMAGYMTYQLIKKLMGVNEFKYRLKLASEAIVNEDWEKPPLAFSFDTASMPVSSACKDLKFIKLKAPMVLYILDKRMTKTERSFGMSRVLPKIYLQAMSGDLTNNSLSTSHFQYVCERVNKSKLEQFFKQWVFGSGVPIFRITQRFNKKRMVVEMGIRQVQLQELGQGKVVGTDGFHSSAMNHLCYEDKKSTQVFTGSMTIRIHEADGTPYEHIVELKDVFTKLDIQYNTKYKRLRRRRKINKGAKIESKDPIMTDGNGKEEDIKNDDENDDVVSVNCLGDVLISKEDCIKWNLTDPVIACEGDDFQQQNEAFEWIRVDADFEWICKIYINQPDYMFVSQLQQDRDVEAQLESIRFFEDIIISSHINSQVYSSILTRTVVDDRYFYGVRLAACRALSKFVLKDTEPNQFSGGAKHLIKIFQFFFCYEDSNIPKNNDFTDYQRYFLQCDIPKYLSNARNERGICPVFIKQFLFDILRYNDNTSNPYDDTFYFVNLINAAVNCTLNDYQDTHFVQDLLNELKRYENLDKWIPSYQLLITKTIILEKSKLSIERGCQYNDTTTLLNYTITDQVNKDMEHVTHAREGLQDLILVSFQALLVDGAIKNKEILKFLFENICFHSDPYIRNKLVDSLIDAIDIIAIKGGLDNLDDDIQAMVNSINPSLQNNDDNEIIKDFNHGLSNRKDMYLRSNINGMITLIRQRFFEYIPLKQIIWGVLHCPLLNVYQRKRLFDISRVIYGLENKFCVKLNIPRDKKLVAKYLGDYKIVIKREGIFKVHLNPKLTKLTGNTQPTTSKLKINIGKSKTSLPSPTKKSKKLSIHTYTPQSDPQIVKNTITKIGSMPLRYVKIELSVKHIHVSSIPFNKNVTVLRSTGRSLLVRINLLKGNLSTE